MNKKIVVGTIIIIIALITSVTIYKVIKKHNDNLMLVSEKYIIEKAQKCYIEKKCTEESVTLKSLYDLNYLEVQVNPVTKEYYKDTSYIIKEEDNYKFIIVD